MKNVNIISMIIALIAIFAGPAAAAEVLAVPGVISQNVIDVRDYGAHSITEPGYANFDSSRAIQSALNKGGIIDFGDGTYNVDHQIHIYSNTTMISSGATLNKTFDIDWNQYMFVCYDAAPSNITIKDMTFNLKAKSSVKDENAVFISLRKPTTNLIIENVTFKNAGKWCVALTQSDFNGTYSKNITIKNCTVEAVENPLNSFFVIMNTDNFLIEGNKFNRGKCQIFVSCSKNGKILKNELKGIDNFWNQADQLGGIDLYNECSNIVVDSNYLESNGKIYDPLVVGIRSKNNSNIYITNNKIEWNNNAVAAIDIRKDGTSTASTSNHYLRYNTVTGTSPMGIKLISIVEGTSINNIYMENNTLKTSSIVLHGTDSLSKVSYNNIYVNNNVCAEISCWKFANSYCQIKYNKIYATGSVGIYARDMINATVSGNTIIGLQKLAYGIDYSYSKGISLEKNYFTNVTAAYKNYNAVNASVVQ